MPLKLDLKYINSASSNSTFVGNCQFSFLLMHKAQQNTLVFDVVVLQFTLWFLKGFPP